MLISVLTSFLGGKNRMADAVFRFSTVMPVSLILFLIVSGISI